MNNAPELKISREFDAPLEKVWQAWTNAERMKQWWGPRGFTSPFYDMDFRVGGKFLGCMTSPDGKDYWSTGVYKEIVDMEKIVSSDSFADKDGNVISASEYGMKDMPMEMTLDVSFEENNGKTKVMIRHVGMPESEQKGARQGWNESLDKLDEELKKM